ncbi:MAG: hypothetical protein EBT15_04385 [Betaproteobacteria bacterium]|nr:hypothetical protein [Betaproteobacteria bacterium]
MPASEVLTKILEDYTANNPTLEAAHLRTFCEYAATWLASKGVVGVGHTPNGLALRLADGSELLLFEPAPEVIIPVPGEVSITGTQSKITKPVQGDAPSFQITGR